MNENSKSDLSSIPDDGIAVIAGAGGAIGGSLADMAEASGRFRDVVRLSRVTTPSLDLLDEASIEAAASAIAAKKAPMRLVIDATGFLHNEDFLPEKSLRQITTAHMVYAFTVNAIGPALLMKHFLPLLPAQGKSVFATLSAKVGSIGDNRLGGWYSYRASKAALNQLLHTAAIETARRRRDAVCLALHPGTVESPLSAPFGKSGDGIRSPQEAARNLIAVIEDADSVDSGLFLDYKGEVLPW
ncbi:SDR family oxidoreductase [Parvibaculum sp.]|uniref:SDR family oxidoreductase n=1 Tax=Parvibaculum sp. TaxID=2024848 RepID=UPI00391DDD1E